MTPLTQLETIVRLIDDAIAQGAKTQRCLSYCGHQCAYTTTLTPTGSDRSDSRPTPTG